MSPAFQQQQRSISVATPLGKDAFLLEGFSGTEEMSRPSLFEVDLLSEDHGIAPADIVGKPITVTVSESGSDPRWFHGRVARFSAGNLVAREFRSYRASVVPWFWFLAKRSGCRIFQGKSVVEIAEQLLGELKFADYETGGISGALPKLDYCVQYRESDLSFLSRLFEDAGIFYSIRHEEDKDVLVLGDSKRAYVPCKEDSVPFSPGTFTPNHVSRWEHRYGFVSGAWAHADFNFETPLSKLRSNVNTVVDLPDTDPFEIYDYPGKFADGSGGDARVRLRMEEEEAGYDVVEGESSCRSFTIGGKFTLASHECANEENQEYVLVGLRHTARDTSYRESGSGTVTYSNSFRCIPAAVAFRPPRVTPKSVVQGPQTAIVVGPSGEEIHTDKYGRVKVQFHWDREGKNDEKSSCWVRVAQNWAGKNWGVVFHPRIGHEVIVDFLEGDPDRPIIVGRVYNADQTPPYEVPANQTQSGIKSRSSKGGDPETFNELRFEDKKDSELVYLHAQKDQTNVVENDQALNVGHDQKVEIGNDQSISVGNNRSEAVAKDRTLSVGANKSEDVADNKSVSVGGNHSESVGGDMSVSVSKKRTMTVTNDLAEDVGGAMTLTVGKDSSTTINGQSSLSIAKDSTITVQGAAKEAVTKGYAFSAKSIQIQADDEIVLKTGDATVQMKKNGDITIKGNKIKIEGSGDVVIKGSKITQN